MNFDWSEYLTLARELLGQPNNQSNNESKLRSAISRAYFASHCIARNYLKYVEADTSIPSNGRAHSVVINKLRDNKRSKEQQIAGADLHNLKIHREKADYDDWVGNLANNAGLALLLAKRIISILKI